MSTPATQTPTLPLGPAILAAMQCAILDALPPHPDASEAQKVAEREGALDFFAALCPCNPVEATIASGIVTAHFAAMDCFRRAARDNLTANLHLRTVGKAIALCRMIDVGMRDLTRRQGGLGLQPAAQSALARPAPVRADPVRTDSVRPQPVQPMPEPAARAQPTHEAAWASKPPQPRVGEARHERRQRERAERHAAAAAQRASRVSGGAGVATQQRLLAELAAARAAAAAVAAAV
jgi:hypothetical protein